MSEISKLPWSIEPCQHDDQYGPIRIADAKGNAFAELWIDDAPVVDFNDQQEANARYIVTAVNAHAALVEALENLVKHMESVGIITREEEPFIEDAKAALKQAKGE